MDDKFYVRSQHTRITRVIPECVYLRAKRIVIIDFSLGFVAHSYSPTRAALKAPRAVHEQLVVQLGNCQPARALAIEDQVAEQGARPGFDATSASPSSKPDAITPRPTKQPAPSAKQARWQDPAKPTLVAEKMK